MYKKITSLIAILALTSSISFCDSSIYTFRDVESKVVGGRLVDDISYPFETDDQLIGSWKSVDFVHSIDSFDADSKSFKGELYLKEMKFYSNGNTSGPWTWTSGLILHSGDSTASRYLIRKIDNKEYLFMEWKSGDYTIRFQDPRFYVLVKESSKANDYTSVSYSSELYDETISDEFKTSDSISKGELARNDNGVANDQKYGAEIPLKEVGPYKGKIKTEGVFVQSDEADYILTLLYEGSEVIETSLFNPPSGSRVMLYPNSRNVNYGEGIIQYRVNQEDLHLNNTISVFLFDQENDTLMLKLDTGDIDQDNVPSSADLIEGYTFSSEIAALDKISDPPITLSDELKMLWYAEVFSSTDFEELDKVLTISEYVELLYKYHTFLVSNDELAALSFDEFANELNYLTEGEYKETDQLNREVLASYLVRTLQLSNIELSSEVSEIKYADVNNISSRLLQYVDISVLNDFVKLVGVSHFVPQHEMNKAAAFDSIRLSLSLVADYNIYREIDKSRVYVVIESSLYAIELSDNVIVDVNSGSLFMKSIMDINKLISISQLKGNTVKFKSLPNPNLRGTLVLPEYNYITQSEDVIYFGVDIVGKTNNIEVKDPKSKINYLASVTNNSHLDGGAYHGFEEIYYYDVEQTKRKAFMLPTSVILETFGYDVDLSENELWNIISIEVEEIKVD